MSGLEVALLQVAPKRRDIKGNMEHIFDLLYKAALKKPDIIVMPELWNVVVRLDKTDVFTSAQHKEFIVSNVKKIAYDFNVNVVAGSVAVTDHNGILRNRSFVFNREGEIIYVFDKIHLYHIMSEDFYMKPGSKVGVFCLDGDIKASVITCFDLDFPEVVRAVTERGAKIVFVPAAWQDEYIYAWEVYLKARALENQIYVVGVNRCDKGEKVSYGGCSMVIAPDGSVVGSLCDKEDTLILDIDLSYVDKVRSVHNIFDKRKPFIYRKWR